MASIALALLVAAVTLVLALRGTDLDAAGAAIAGAQPALLALSLALLFVSYLLRACRWRVLLRDVHPELKLATVYEASSIGYLANNLLPARAGDVIRAVALKRRSGVSRSYGFATTVVERTGDVVWLAVLTVLLSATTAGSPDWLREAAAATMLIALGVVAVLLTAYMFRTRIVGRIRRHSWGGRAARVEHAVRAGGAGLATLGKPRRLGTFAFLTSVIWLIDGCSFIAVVAAVGPALSIDESLLLLCALGLASAAPSTPGYVGIFQFVAVSVLPAFDVTRHDALAAIILFQLVILLEVSIAGVAVLGRAGADFATLRRDAASGATDPAR